MCFPAQLEAMTLDELKSAVSTAESVERIKRGLPPDHVLDFAEFPFAFAGEAVGSFVQTINAWRMREPASADAAYNCAVAALAVREYAKANRLMETAQALDPQNIKLRMRFGFEPPPSSFQFPPVAGEYPTEPAFFFSCDEHYFSALCRPLLASIAEHSPGVRCHVHLIDCDSAIMELVKTFPLALSFTNEHSGLKHAPDHVRWNYYNAIRYIRFADAMERIEGPLWVADVDALVTGDIRPMLRAGEKAALRVRPGQLDPWHQIVASLAMGTRSSRPYFRRVADIIKAEIQHAWWGVDQYAMFSALLDMKSDVSLLGPNLADHGDVPALFWFTTGSRKLSLAAADSPYARLHRRYLEWAIAREPR